MRQSIEVDIQDIHCKKCAHKIALALEQTLGVETSEVNFKERQASLVIDNLMISRSKIKAIIIALGFSAILI